MAEFKRLTINLSPELHKELVEMANERGITVTELIRRAIALDKFMWEHRDADLLLKEGDQVQKIVRV